MHFIDLCARGSRTPSSFPSPIGQRSDSTIPTTWNCSATAPGRYTAWPTPLRLDKIMTDCGTLAYRVGMPVVEEQHPSIGDPAQGYFSRNTDPDLRGELPGQ